MAIKTRSISRRALTATARPEGEAHEEQPVINPEAEAEQEPEQEAEPSPPKERVRLVSIYSQLRTYV